MPDALERYLAGMADLYEVSGISARDRRCFHNFTRSTLSPSGVVGEGRSVRQTLARTPALLRRSEVDGLIVSINRTAMVGDCDGRSVRAGPGALQFRDLSRPSMTRLDTVDMHLVMIPRNLAPADLLERRMHGLVLSPDEPGVRLLTAQLGGLVEEAEHLTDPELDTAIQALLMVASRLAGGEAPIRGPALAAVQTAVRRIAADYVEARLHAKALPIDIGAIAKAAGVSRSALYRAFDDDGGVGRYVQDRRLHHARGALRRRRGAHPTIAEISDDHGFASATHFSRLFKERYGYAPSEVGAASAPVDLSMSAGPIRHDLLSDWLVRMAPV